MFTREADLKVTYELLEVSRVALVRPADKNVRVVRGEARRGGEHEGVLVGVGFVEARELEEFQRVAPCVDLVEDLRRAVVENGGNSRSRICLSPWMHHEQTSILPINKNDTLKHHGQVGLEPTSW